MTIKQVRKDVENLEAELSNLKTLRSYSLNITKQSVEWYQASVKQLKRLERMALKGVRRGKR
jgi:hypothetical protein